MSLSEETRAELEWIARNFQRSRSYITAEVLDINLAKRRWLEPNQCGGCCGGQGDTCHSRRVQARVLAVIHTSGGAKGDATR